MTLLLYLIGRLFVIGFAVLIALIAGSMFIGFGLASGLFPELLAGEGSTVFADPDTERNILTGISILFGVLASFQLAGIALLPVTIAIAMTEMMRWILQSGSRT